MCDIAGNPIGAAVFLIRGVTGLNQDRAHAGVLSAADVAGFVADKKRAAKIEALIALRFENHPGAWFSPDRSRGRQIGAMIARIDQTVAELSQEFCFNDALLVLGKRTEPDSDLIRN